METMTASKRIELPVTGMTCSACVRNVEQALRKPEGVLDVMFMFISGDLCGFVRLIQLSKATLRTIYQNLFWAFIYNIVLIPVAMMGLLILLFAAVAMSFSSLFVVSDSLRLRGRRIKGEQPTITPVEEVRLIAVSTQT